jgi:hypothetical protein
LNLRFADYDLAFGGAALSELARACIGRINLGEVMKLGAKAPRCQLFLNFFDIQGRGAGRDWHETGITFRHS